MTETRDDLCAIHGWVELGTVSTDTASFAIVDPCYADEMSKVWNKTVEQYDRIEELLRHNFLELKLRNPHYPDQTPPSWFTGDPAKWFIGEYALWLRVDGDGGYRVLGRFEDPYGDGHMQLAEVRIILIEHHDEDEEE